MKIEWFCKNKNSIKSEKYIDHEEKITTKLFKVTFIISLWKHFAIEISDMGLFKAYEDFSIKQITMIIY